MQTLQNIATHPGTGIVLTLVLTVWAWKLNATGANWMLVLAFVVGAYTIFRVLPAQDTVIRSLSTMVAAGLLGLFLYVNLWTHPIKLEGAAASVPAPIAPTKEEIAEEVVNRLLKERKPEYANATDREKALLAKYPAGYILYLADRANHVVPYESRANDFDIQRITLSSDAKGLTLSVPLIYDKKRKNMIAKLSYTFASREGYQEELYGFGDVTVFVEVLAFHAEETAFVLGFVEQTNQVAK